MSYEYSEDGLIERGPQESSERRNQLGAHLFSHSRKALKLVKSESGIGYRLYN
tara:strand:- start:686 stop:844 length:159 start_codon:yes stop_codon:yes gene_type:complete